MDDFLDFLNNNRWLNIVFIILALGGIVATIITYLRTRKEKIPVYDKFNFNLISKKLSRIDNLSINYNNSSISELSVCQIAIYNFGRSPIKRADIANKDKLRISVKDGEILSYELKFTKREVTNFNIALQPDKKSILIDFDFLEYFDGGVIQFFHNEPKEENIKIEGTIIGGGKISYSNDKLFTLKYGTQFLKWIKKGKYTYLLKAIMGLPILLVILVIGLIELANLKINKFPDEYNLNKENWL